MSVIYDWANPEEAAKVILDAKKEGFKLGTEYTRERLWMAFRGNFMTSSQINDQEKEIYRILNGICDDIEEQSDWYCETLLEDKEARKQNKE